MRLLHSACRMESISDPDLQTPPQPGATRLSVVGVRVVLRRIRWVDGRVVAAKVIAVERVEQINDDCGGLHGCEVDVLLQPHIEILIAEDMADPEERTRRWLEDVRALLTRRKPLTCIRSIDGNARTEIHNRAEPEIVRKPGNTVGYDRMPLITRGNQAGPIRDRRITVIEAPE